MKKLFSLESSNPLEKNQLLVDQVIEYSKLDKTPLNLTATILTNKQNLKAEIEKKLNINDEGSNDSDDSDDSDDKESSTFDDLKKEVDDNDSDDDKDGEKDTDEKKEDSKEEDDDEEEEKDKKKDSDSKSSKSNEKDTDDDDEDEDLGASADNEKDLDSIVGSEVKSKTTTESRKEFNRIFIGKNKYTSPDVFKQLKAKYAKYKVAMEKYKIDVPNKVENHPIAYVRNEVIDALNNLIQIANKYIENNKEFNLSITNGIKKLNEEITIFRTYAENEKHHFNFQLVTDKDVLSLVSVPNKSDLRYTSKLLETYSDEATKLVVTLLNNKFNEITKAFKTFNYKDHNTANYELIYANTVPGFNNIIVAILPYKSYIKTNMEDYTFYKIKRVQTEDLLNLDAIGINKDNEFIYILDKLNKLLLNSATLIENLNIINTNFNKFIDDIKVMIYDVDKLKVSDLASLKIDDMIKDCIKFKMAIEVIYVSINILIEYISAVVGIIKSTVSLTSKAVKE